MKLEKRHLAVLAVTAGAVAYVWVQTRPAGSPPPNAPSVAGASATSTAPAGGATMAGAIDPVVIPAPPKVDLTNPPSWPRNPFAAPERQSAAEVTVAAAPAIPDPVVRSILYSSQRRAALVDGRIVSVGDQLSAGRVVAIERDSVLIEDARGERRRLELKRSLE